MNLLDIFKLFVTLNWKFPFRILLPSGHMIHHVRKTQQSILGSISIFLSESVHEHLNFVESMYFSSI